MRNSPHTHTPHFTPIASLIRDAKLSTINQKNTMKNLTDKQSSRLAKIEARFPQFTFRVFDLNDKRETVTAWGIGVSADADKSTAYAARPETKNGLKGIVTAHTERGNVELTAALKAACAALWHHQPVFEP